MYVLDFARTIIYYYTYSMKLIKFLFVLIIVLLGVGLYRTWKVDQSPLDDAFQKGTVPSPLPDGFYKKSLTFDAKYQPWKGKTFIASESAGINVVTLMNQEKSVFPFKTYIGKGIQNRETDVLKIDYDIPQNPFYIKPIVDEIVEIEPGKYLGKAHIRLIPSFPFTLIYFQLIK